MAQIVLNDILCYLVSSRNIIPKEDIIENAVSFYKDDAIIRAKAEVFKLNKEKNIARKSCPSYPNVNVKHFEDILYLFSKKDDNPLCPRLLLQKDSGLCHLLGLRLLHP